MFLETTVSLWAQTNGQNPERHFYNWALGFGHSAADSSRWRSANVGILAATDTLHGFQIGGISSIAHYQMKGVSIGGLFAASGGRIDGFQAAFGMNTLGGEMRGLQLAAISNAVEGFFEYCTGRKGWRSDKQCGKYCIENNARHAVGKLQLC